MLPMMGKWLIAAGILLVVVGVVIWGLGHIPGLGRLPGDIYFRRGNFTFYFPLVTCILISIVVSLLLMFLRR